MVTIQEYLDQEYPLNGVCQGNFDKQNQGKRREEITELDISSKNLVNSEWSLNGFTSLKKLNCSSNSILGIPFADISSSTEEIDFSNNLGLTSWVAPHFFSSQLKKLSFSNNSNIRDIDALMVPQLTHFDVSKNNLLTRLNLRNNSNLQMLNCSGDSLLNDLTLPSSASPELIDCQNIVSPEPNKTNKTDNGLNTGEIIGIIVGILSFIVAVVGVVIAYKDYKNNKKKKERARSNQAENGETNQTEEIGLDELGVGSSTN